MLWSRFRAAGSLTAALALLAVAGTSPALAAPTLPGQASPVAKSHVEVCPGPPQPGTARCFALRRTDATALNSRPVPGRRPAPSPDGSAGSASTLGNSGAYDPSYLQSAYNVWNVALAKGGNQTVAIVDAYDDPQAASDLAYYRNFFALPPANVQKVNQNGVSSPLPGGNSSWAQETSLDLDMVSAICPNCTILLVEAASSSYSDLATAVNTAAKMGATVISNSYGGSELSTESIYDSSYNHPGTAITVSSGDNGYGVEYPAASQYVTAVGGTSLNQATNTGSRDATETSWSGAGSGCSAYETKPSWQKDSGCSKRTVADVSAVADPNTGVWVYDTYAASGWSIFGGTSVASPIVGSVYALAQSNGNTTAQSSSFPYANSNDLNDITSGSNGTCSPAYLCTGEPGYDGPSGLGTPNSAAGFAPAPATSFSLSSSPTSATVSAGATCGTSTTPCTTIGLASQSGYSGTVDLTASSPAGITASLSLAAVTLAANGTASSALTLSVASTVAAGTYNVTVTGTDSASSGSTSSTTFTVNVVQPDFAISASPISANVSAGTTCGTASSPCSTITLTSQNGYSGTVNLAASSPTGITSSLSANAIAVPAGGSATVGLNVGVANNQAANSYTVTVSATDASSHAHSTNFTVKAADFTLGASPSSATVAPGASCSSCSSMTVTSENGYSAPVSLSTSTPAGIRATLASASLTPPANSSLSTSLSVSVASGVASGAYPITITGTDGSGNTHSTTFTVNVGVSDYSMGVSPSSRRIKHGGSTTYTVTLNETGAYTSPIALSVSGLPSGVNATFSPNPAVFSGSSTSTQSTLSISSAGWAARGAYSLTITGKGADGTTHSVNGMTLTIQ